MYKKKVAFQNLFYIFLLISMGGNSVSLLGGTINRKISQERLYLYSAKTIKLSQGAQSLSLVGIQCGRKVTITRVSRAMKQKTVKMVAIIYITGK